jgi:purine-binding chemotaxis protein CheW
MSNAFSRDGRTTAAALDADPQAAEAASSAALHVPGQHNYCLFTCNGQRLGIAVSAVREVLTGKLPTPVPRSPRALVGVIAVRGEVVPVVQLGSLLGIPVEMYTPNRQILLVSSDGVEVGLVVDHVLNVYTLDPRSIADTAMTSSATVSQGSWSDAEGVVPILDADRVVAAVLRAVSQSFNDAIA